MPVLTEKQQAKAAQKQAKMRWQKARIAEREYQRALVNVGRQVGAITNGFAKSFLIPEQEAIASRELDEALKRYADLITPWATRVTERMHAEVAWRDLRAWQQLSRAIGRGLRVEIETAPTGALFRSLMAEQVTLIRSLPLEAAQRVHERARQAMLQGTRFDELMGEILATGKVTVGRARLIARTETARTSSTLTQARAEHIGSDAYVWRTAEDEQVRPDHKKLNGKVFHWNDPPLAGPKQRYHAGQGPNCRCYPEPILPD